MTTEGCVTQSAIDARELGLKVTVVPDACATAKPRVEETAVRYLVDVVGVKLRQDAGETRPEDRDPQGPAGAPAHA